MIAAYSVTTHSTVTIVPKTRLIFDMPPTPLLLEYPDCVLSLRTLFPTGDFPRVEVGSVKLRRLFGRYRGVWADLRG